MSWAIGFDNHWKRDIGYGVPATCDHPGCCREIDRGLNHVCGSEPYGGEHGCGLYFCAEHLRTAGDARDNVELCSKCYSGKGGCFDPTPDTSEWVAHKLTDSSWKQWRDENPKEVASLEDAL